ncbi:septum formation family protein [Subtercola boreus]|uniref:Septum formation-related domain-containing protein n=1 Tax=Subtercola boreus TaxID=120213 RepID=A0A3E0W6H0_9MICO|nr:septum formation family protein [Subtercola boreus]RFA18005.1 hypothetical protein B7R24_15220 [Subtercola boreus]RFA18387.1 hypothetical protein B7R23_15255 [Subtercola boreus]RFA24916.1 hypothetical protein B7R25_15250 [Subtercola boreus]
MSPEATPGETTAVPDDRRRRRARRRVVAGVLALVVLAALFFAGTRLPGILNPAPASLAHPAATSATPTPTPTPAPTSTAGPQLAGTFEWFELRGGECIAPFTSAWQQRFTVVDCQVPHGAQVMGAGSLSTDATAAYPGQAALSETLNLLCQKPENVDSSILGAYPDVVWQAGYPVNEAQWKAGQRTYYCFVSRSSSLPLLGSFAAPAVSG